MAAAISASRADTKQVQQLRRIVAEGVETQSEATKLKSLNCEFAQGYLFGAPMDATAAYNFIALRARGQSAAPQQPKQVSGLSHIPRKL